MWMLLRTAALAVLALVAVLVAGRGAWLPVAEGLAGWLGAGDALRDGAQLAWPVGPAGLGLGLLLALVVPGVIDQVDTLLHELGHTVMAAAWGARPAGIVLRHDASGHATARWTRQPGPARRIGLAATAFAGMPAPALAAAAGTQLLLVAGARPVLWAAAGVGVVVALLARSAWSLLVAGGLVALALLGLSEALAPWATVAVVAVLTAVALGTALRALRRLVRPLPAGDDAWAVRRQLPLPARLVQVLQVVLSVGVAAWTVWLLLAASGVELRLGERLGL